MRPLRLVLTAVVPLLFVPWAFEVREAPRQYLVLVLAAGVAMTARWRSPPAVRANISALLFVSALLLVSLASDSPWRSLMGPFPAGDSALVWVALVTLAALAPPKSDLGIWTGSFIALGVFQAAVAVCQAALGTAPSGTLGHPMFLSCFCGLASIVALAWLLDAAARPTRILAAACTALLCVAVVATGQRTPLFACVAGMAVLLVTVRPSRRAVPWLVAGILVIGATSMAPSMAWRGETILAPWQRWIAFSPDSVTSLEARYADCEVAWQRILERPVLGFGFGSFRDHFAAAGPASMPQVEKRVHSVWLEVALGGGAVTLIALVGLMLVWMQRALRVARAREDESTCARRAACAAVAVAYLTYLSVNFDQVGMSVWVWSLFGFALPRSPAPVVRPGLALRLAALTAGAVTIGVAIAALATSLALGQGVREEARGALKGALAWYERAANLVPNGCVAELHRARLLRRFNVVGTAALRVTFLQQCATQHPALAWVWYHLGLAHLDAAAFDPEQLAAAEDAMARAKERAPTQVQILRGVAQVAAAESDALGALRTLERAHTIEPNDAAVHNDLGLVLYRLNRKSEALEHFLEAIRLDGYDPTFRRNYERVRAEQEGLPLSPR